MDDKTYAEEVMQRLNALPELRTEEMFGGYAIYSRKVFFAIVYKNRLYFRVNPVTRKDFETYGSSAFQPSDRVRLTTYFEVPEPIAANDNELLEWARKAIGKVQP